MVNISIDTLQKETIFDLLMLIHTQSRSCQFSFRGFRVVLGSNGTKPEAIIYLYPRDHLRLCPFPPAAPSGCWCYSWAAPTEAGNSSQGSVYSRNCGVQYLCVRVCVCGRCKRANSIGGLPVKPHTSPVLCLHQKLSLRGISRQRRGEAAQKYLPNSKGMRVAFESCCNAKTSPFQQVILF